MYPIPFVSLVLALLAITAGTLGVLLALDQLPDFKPASGHNELKLSLDNLNEELTRLGN